ncbi:MAG: TPM domain-containing protein, partial [Methanogenium sp.]
MNVFKSTILIISSILFLSPALVYSLDVPEYHNWVNDYANVIDDDVESVLNNTIAEFEEKTSSEITVVTINSLDGENLEDFSMKIADNWKVGKEDKDNGIMLLFAIAEKRVRLEVGYGLEGVINDAKAGRILDDCVVEFRDEGDYTNAAKNGVECIIQEIGTEEWTEEQSGSGSAILLFIIIGFFGLFFICAIFSSSSGGSIGSGFIGGGIGLGSGGGSSGGSCFGG